MLLISSKSAPFAAVQDPEMAGALLHSFSISFPVPVVTQTSKLSPSQPAKVAGSPGRSVRITVSPFGAVNVTIRSPTQVWSILLNQLGQHPE